MTGLNQQHIKGTYSGTDVPDDIDLRSVVMMFLRRKWMLFGIVLAGMALTFAALNFLTPRYAAQATFLIEGDAEALPLGEEAQSLMAAFGGESGFVLNELEVVRSRGLARNVVEWLHLMDDPEFNDRLRTMKSAEDKKSEGTLSTFKQFNLFEKQMPTGQHQMLEGEIDIVVSAFLERLRVRSLAGSNVLEITFTSEDPRKAALIANTIADMYIEQRLEEKSQSARRLTAWLDKRLADIRRDVQDSAAAVQGYKLKHNLSEGLHTMMSAEQLTQLNAQLVLAKAQKAEAEARLVQVKSAADNPEKNIEAVAEIVNSSLIHRLKLELSRMRGELSDLSSRYGAKHPEMKKRRAELHDLQGELKAEMMKIAASLENELYVAEARLEALRENLDEVQETRHAENQKMIRLQELVREAESNRVLYDSFMLTYKRANQREALEEPAAKVISYAAIPQEAAYPDKMLFLFLSGLVSLFFGLVVALILEKLDNTFHSAAQLEQYTELPCLALIPDVAIKSVTEASNHVLAKPASTVAEAVRTLKMVLNLRALKNGVRPKVITITSSFPGEGKTMLSTWLARLAAKSGDKVIVVDCDLRRPNIHRTLGRKNENTLVEYLTGKNDLEEVIQRDDSSGMHVIYGRCVPNSALDLVSSAHMEKLVKSLGDVYDLVILDSPACLAVADARVLAKYSDHTVYVVGWNKTPRAAVKSGIKQFTDMNYVSLSAVMTGVDAKRYMKYGYGEGESVYYYGRYYKAA